MGTSMSNVSDSVCNSGLCTNSFIPVAETKDVQDKKDWHLYLPLCYMLAIIATLLLWSS